MAISQRLSCYLYGILCTSQKSCRSCQWPQAIILTSHPTNLESDMPPIRDSSSRGASTYTRYAPSRSQMEQTMWPQPLPYRAAQPSSYPKYRHTSHSYEGQAYGSWHASTRNNGYNPPHRRKKTTPSNRRGADRQQIMSQEANRLEQTYHPSLSSTSSRFATPNFTMPLPGFGYRPISEPSAMLPGFINQSANAIPRISHEYAPTSRSRYMPASIPPQTEHYHNHGINRDPRYQTQRATLPSYLPQRPLSRSASCAQLVLPPLVGTASLPRSGSPQRNFDSPLSSLLPAPGDASTWFSGYHLHERQHEEQSMSIIDWELYDAQTATTESLSVARSITPFEQDSDIFYAHGRGVHVFNTPISRATVRAAEVVTASILPSYQDHVQRKYLEWEGLKQEQQVAMEKIDRLIQLDEDFGAILPSAVVGAQDAMEAICDASSAPTSLPTVDSQIPTFAEMLEDTSWL